jgi:hypothetical protein
MKLTFLTRVTEKEYRANLTGMNTFFGAVLGFVLADAKTESLIGFGHLLFLSAGVVISILYVSASSHRWLYAGMTMLMILALPRLLDEWAGGLGRLQVTLALWLLLTVFIEALWAWQQKRDAKATKSAA